jgi:hypothetical protein
MRRLAIASVAVAVVLFASGLSAQGKDFSGKWAPDAEKNAAAMGGGGRGGGRGGGGPMTITQDAKTLTMEREGANGSTKTVYNLDGSDSKNMQPGRQGGAATEVVSTAKWDGDKLMITTKTANGDRVTSWYLEGGELVSETQGQNGAIKLYYKKG